MKRIYKYQIAFVIILLATASFSHAQEGAVKGKVQGKEEILKAATVSIGKKTVITNEAGEFFISAKPGAYILSISYAGYQSIRQEIMLKANETVEINFTLEKADQLTGVVVLGSRSSIKRSSMNTAVPVDVIKGNKLPVAATSLTEKLFITVPSFNSPPQTVGGSVVVNPASLRGLSPDQALVSLNGHRLHNSASVLLQYSLGYGTSPTDLNCIPAAAIEDVQVLRDGAAAQYGSDAIAGVIDIQLKKSTGKTEANLHLGQFYKGDGETISFDINRGFQLNKKGFINFTGAVRFSNPTQRSGVYDSTVYSENKVKDDSMVLARGFDRLNHRRIGSPEVFNTSLIMNGGYPINKRIDLFWTGTFNYCHTTDIGSTAYRYPKNTNTVITYLYPDGFQPKFFAPAINASILAGIEGQTINDWHWDISSVYGGNANKSYIINTNNATQYALGKDAQTNFELGSVSFSQNTNNINFSRNFANQLNQIKSLSVSFGGEFRIENYQISSGEEASWKNYAPPSGKQWGSQGVAGFSDSNAVNKNRYAGGVYAELEMEPNEKFLWNIAGRYEHYSDYGGNLAGKLALRYKFSNQFLLRGSFSNGFRAPSLQQRFYSNASPTKSRVNNNILIAETFRNDSHTAEAFCIAPLQAEKSLNISSGITSRISKNINITLDAYWIQINNRIILSGLIPKDNSDQVKSILNNLHKNDIGAIRFFANAISTRTKGIDLVATGNWPIGKSQLEISLSGNYNKTTIYKAIQPAKALPDDIKHLNLVINREERGRLEQGQPLSKIVLALNFKMGKWEFNSRMVYFGKAAHLAANIDTNTYLYPDEFFSPKILAGCNIGYSPKPWVTIKAGAKNIFNNYPDKVRNRANTQAGLIIYDFNGTQIGYNGGYYFLNVTFNF